MRKSNVLKKLREGNVANCLKVNLYDQKAVEIAAMAGADCIWTDMEHVANDDSVIEKQVLAAKAYDTDILVRVSRGGYSEYIHPLELDASGIMVPHIMGLEDARNIIRMTRFHPIGRRPVDGGNADGRYTRLPMREYMELSNREKFLILQIEDPEPLDDLEKIAALEGFDMLFFGPADFSQGIGDPGNFDNPLLKKTMELVPRIAKKHGKYAGTVGSVENVAELIDMGYSFINIGADVVALWDYFADKITRFNKKQADCGGGYYADR